MRETQNSKILTYLAEGNTITPLKALKLFGCMRLGARIWDLKKMGNKIYGRTVAVKTRNGIAHIKEYGLYLKGVK